MTGRITRPGAGRADPHANEPIGTVEQIYGGTLDADLAVATFRNTHRLFPTRAVPARGDARPLPVSDHALGPVLVRIGARDLHLDEVLSRNRVTGLIVLKQGAVVHERYLQGNRPETRWMSMSVAKSITATLLGVAIAEGRIDGLEACVTDHVPALSGSAYEGVTIGQVLRMCSGVAWSETYTDPGSDRRALLRAQQTRTPGALMGVMAGLPRAGAPGTIHSYSTGETQVLAEVIRAAVGQPLAQYLSDRIWTPCGMEADAAWCLESEDGIEIGGSGLCATLRDFARFGQFILDRGVIDGRSILPAGWTEAAGRPHRLPNGETIDYGDMWWPGWTAASRADRAFAAVGIHGQHIYINPARRVVVAVTAAQPEPVGGAPVDMMDLIDALVAALRRG